MKKTIASIIDKTFESLTKDERDVIHYFKSFSDADKELVHEHLKEGMFANDFRGAVNDVWNGKVSGFCMG